MHNNEQAALPASMRYLSTVISWSAVARLVKARPGTRIVIPKKAADGHWLADLIGMDEMRKLSRHYGGGSIDIPRCVKTIVLARDEQILADKRQGLTLNALALKYRMTERGVTKALRRTEQIELRQLQSGSGTDSAGRYQQIDLFAFLIE